MKRLCSLSLALLGCNSLIGNEEGELTEVVEVVPEQGIPGHGDLSVGVDDTSGQLEGMGWFLWYGDGGNLVPNGYVTMGNRTVCTRKRKGGCELVECSWTVDPSVVLNDVKYESAGTVTAQCGSGPAVEFTRSTNPGDYSLEDGGSCGLGSMVTIAATGDVAPAFSAQVRVLGALTVNQPNPKADLTLRRSQGLDVRWSGETAGTVEIRASAAEGDGQSGKRWELSCKGEAAAGHLALPASMLAPIPLLTQVLVSVSHSDVVLLEPSASWRYRIGFHVIGSSATAANWTTTMLD